jgi:CRP-like cAMP-binding protein
MRKVLFLFSQLIDADVEWMIACGEKQRVSAGTVLIHEGRDIDTMHLVLDGVLEVSVTAGDKPV